MQESMIEGRKFIGSGEDVPFELKDLMEENEEMEEEVEDILN